MKFKYTLGDRLLFKTSTDTAESMGTVTGIHHEITKAGSKTTYCLNDGAWRVTDSDILGTVTVKRTVTPRVRKSKNKDQKQTELNGIGGEVGHFTPLTTAEVQQ